MLLDQEEQMDILPDPAGMTAEERFLELASILARGYMRLRKGGFAPVIQPESAESRLDFGGAPRPPLGSGFTPEREVAG